MTTTETRMTMIFNEWARRYAEKPDDWSEILDEEGKPFNDYGESAMRTFCKIAKEMDDSGLLPTYNPENEKP
jgi:hypothetical protein